MRKILFKNSLKQSIIRNLQFISDIWMVNWRDANLLFNGQGISQDGGKGVEHSKKSSDQGNLMGQFCYGSCFAIGQTVKLHIFPAGQLFQCVVSECCSQTHAVYGYYLREGFGLAANFMLAAEQFQLSFHKGDLGRTNLLTCLS
jgi:TPR repeat protein